MPRRTDEEGTCNGKRGERSLNRGLGADGERVGEGKGEEGHWVGEWDDKRMM
jgi:hypothetical protein